MERFRNLCVYLRTGKIMHKGLKKIAAKQKYFRKNTFSESLRVISTIILVAPK